jgi:hypothetical protein
LCQLMTQAALVYGFQHPGPVTRCTSMARPMTCSVSSRASSIPLCLRAASWSFVASVLRA